MRQVLFLILFVLITLSFAGCCEKEIVYQDRWKKQLITTKCIVPDSNCSWYGNNSVLSANMYACILQMREDIKVCQKEETSTEVIVEK